MTKNFNEEVMDLKNGLLNINKILENPTIHRRKYESATLNKEIQIARIDFFIKGYNFCKKEIKAQTKLT